MDEDDLLDRVTGRRVHPESGRVYHIDTNPPLVEGIDDITGEPLIQRNTDSPERHNERIEKFSETEGPLLEYYDE